MQNPRVRAAILQIVENQLRNDDPPDTKQTLERLLAAGHTRDAAVAMIGTAVTTEIWEILHEHKTFDLASYISALKELR